MSREAGAIHTCEADTLGSHGYVYLAIYPATNMDVNHEREA
ncbi:type IV toxin-antitoxin system YeeU family antitoxin [Aeromonas caviae]|nr:type IV toxin-antitoxin system YeeU family antitoxin [Aeromonas caviae]